MVDEQVQTWVRLMKKTSLIASMICVVMSNAGTAYAVERYATFSFMLPSSEYEFGGQNTVGGFSNADTQASGTIGFQATYGLEDAFSIGVLPVSAEFDLAFLKSEKITSASFPGLPSPTFFYDSDVKTLRLGASFWSPFITGKGYKTELGVGLGVVYRDISTTDGVSSGANSDTAGYGQIGVRHVWEVSKSSEMIIGLNYVYTGETNVPLSFGGSAAGNLTQRSDSVELSVGYRILLGK